MRPYGGGTIRRVPRPRERKVQAVGAILHDARQNRQELYLDVYLLCVLGVTRVSTTDHGWDGRDGGAGGIFGTMGGTGTGTGIIDNNIMN